VERDRDVIAAPAQSGVHGQAQEFRLLGGLHDPPAGEAVVGGGPEVLVVVQRAPGVAEGAGVQGLDPGGNLRAGAQVRDHRACPRRRASDRWAEASGKFTSASVSRR